MASPAVKTPGHRATLRPVSGFTLLEMLLVLGLMALMAGLFVVATKSWLPGAEGSNAQVLQDAIHAARARAVVSDAPVVLRVAADGRGLTLEAGNGSRSFQLAGDAAVRFMRSRFGGPGEDLVVPLPSEVSKGVRFYSDGTCDAFVAMFRAGGGEDQVLAVDPWNCTAQPLATRDT